MKITNELLQDSIHCLYKIYKKVNQHSPIESQSEIILLYRKLKEEHKAEFERRSINQGNASLGRHGVRKARSAFNYNLKNEQVDLTFDAIETTGRSNTIPVLTVPFEKISRTDKLFIAYQVFLACREFDIKVDHCKIVYGEKFRITKLKISSLNKKIGKFFDTLKKVLSASNPPVFFRNSHCQVCEFRNSCLERLRERDDLSLLSGLKPREIAQKNSRGIFTVKQLSYMFRAKKNPYRSRKYSPELKALAIRDGKTYVQEKWLIPRSQTEIFLDIEGIPEKNLNYLIGVVIRTEGSEKCYSFWANDKNGEAGIFMDLITVISKYDDYVIYHYGSYEQQALRNASKSLPEQLPLITRMLESCFNVLSLFTKSIYSPTYSNGLKEIAKFLNFEWTESNATGLQSIVWRYDWEISGNELSKQKLLQYNNEDCKALMKVFDWICTIDQSNKNSGFLPAAKQSNIYKWGITNYALEDFKEINSKAYFNYQRHRIRLREGKKTVVSRSSAMQQSGIYNKVQSKVNLFPTKCPKCKSSDLVVIHIGDKIQLDLVFMKTGLKSSVIKYSGGPFVCRKCKRKFKAGNMRTLSRYGSNLMLWAVNQKIQYQLSSESVINVLRDSLKIDVSPTQMTRFKEVIAQRYVDAYKGILENILSSKLIHIDETIARIKGIDGYVWVFANHECVYYEFRESRETDFLKDRLRSFSGTLVSDFYTGYDSIECKQQKCLVHLIRDMNEDYLKNQFDSEFKTIVIEFGKLLRSIIVTIDQYGLRKFHLNKHWKDVKRFYAKFINRDFESDMAQNYRRRLTKYKERIFGFLKEDDIPWNNNNAEYSIKPFAKWRKRKTSNLTIDNIRNHLILLSILQTCKYKGISFFEFMKSGELNLFNLRP